MSVITVYVAKAVLCIAAQCWPVLTGPTVPLGQHQLELRTTAQPGYGGDFLQFSEDDKYIYAIHRVWTLRPSEHREARLKSPNPAVRNNITRGCVNVDYDLYDFLVNNYRDATLIVEP